MKQRLSLLIITLSTMAATGCSQDGPAAPEHPKGGPRATVVTVRAELGDVLETIETFGSVEFDAHEIRTLSFVRSGRVATVLVAPGQPVARDALLLRLGALPTSSPEVARARIDLEFAKQNLARLERLRRNQLATNEAVGLAEKDLESARAVLAGQGGGEKNRMQSIRAPFAGVVVKVPAKAGAIVQPGQEAVSLAPEGALAVRAGFEPENTALLAPGMSVLVTPLFTSGSEEPAHASLALLHRVVDQQTQMIEALIRPAQAPGWMVAGERVRVEVIVRSANNVVRLPREALLERDATGGVFVVESGLARWRPVEVGIASEDWLEIRKGVEPGDSVVTTGRTSLTDKMAVVAGKPGE
jgi:membrane fusion protein, multidrug efflux system